MRILFLAPIVNLNSPDAQAVHVTEIANAFCEAGHEVFILAGADGSVTGLAQSVTILPLSNGGGLWGKLVRDLKILRDILKYHRENNQTILYARAYVLGFVPALLAKILGMPFVAEVNGMYIDDRRLSRAYPRLVLAIPGMQWLAETALRGMLSFGYYLAKDIIVVAPGLVDYLRTMHGVRPEKVHCCPNGVNIEQFAHLERGVCRQELGLEPNKRYVGFVGSLTPWQGLECLLRAVALLEDRDVGLNVIIVGSGVEEAKLKQMVADLKLDGQVRLVGGVSHDTARKYVRAVDFIAAPYTMTWPRSKIMAVSGVKIPEALAAGSPVVTVRLPGLEYVENHSLGWLFEPDQDRELAGVLAEAVSLDEQRYSQISRRAQEYAQNHLSWKKTAQCIGIFFTGYFGETE